MPTPEKQSILQRIVCQKTRAVNEEWVTIIHQATLEQSILLFCQQHFELAVATPFGLGHPGNLLAGSRLTEAGKQMLNGTFASNNQANMTQALRAFLWRLAIPGKL